MFAVPAFLRRSQIVDDHVADPDGAMLLVEQILGQRAGYDLGEMLVLGDRQHLFLGQPAQGNAVFEDNHDTSLGLPPRCCYP